MSKSNFSENDILYRIVHTLKHKVFAPTAFLQLLQPEAIDKENYSQFPFVIGHNKNIRLQPPQLHEVRPEQAGHTLVMANVDRPLAIYPSQFLSYLDEAMIRIPLYESDAYVISHAHVPILSPYSLGINSITMGVVFGVLLDVFKQAFTRKIENTIAANVLLHTCLLISCLIIYPLVYLMGTTQILSSKSALTRFPLKNLVAEGGKLFLVLEGMPTGMTLFEQPYNAVAATGFVTALSTFLESRAAIAECKRITNIESFSRILHSVLTFGPLCVTLNKLSETLVSSELKYRLIEPALIIGMLGVWGKLLYDVFERLKHSFIYTERFSPNYFAPYDGRKAAPKGILSSPGSSDNHVVDLNPDNFSQSDSEFSEHDLLLGSSPTNYGTAEGGYQPDEEDFDIHSAGQITEITPPARKGIRFEEPESLVTPRTLGTDIKPWEYSVIKLAKKLRTSSQGQKLSREFKQKNPSLSPRLLNEALRDYFIDLAFEIKLA